MLKHVADKHNKKDIQIQGYEEKYDLKEHQVHIEDQEKVDSDKFKCRNCKKIVLRTDALMTYAEGSQNEFSLCTILSYREK